MIKECVIINVASVKYIDNFKIKTNFNYCFHFYLLKYDENNTNNDT